MRIEVLPARFGIFLVRLRCGAGAADVNVQLAEIKREATVHLEVDRLVAEEDDAVPAEGLLQRAHLLARQRPGEIDVADLGADVRRKRLHGEGRHGHDLTIKILRFRGGGMAKSPVPWLPAGVIPAVVLPFNEDLSIDERSYRSHLRDVASVEGVSAITVNAHASEVASCTFDEQRRVLEISKEELGDLPIVNGIYADGSLEAARLAKMAEQGGAAALLVFPSAIYAFGQRAEMAVAHFKRIADATSLPLILFQYPLAG